MKVNVNEQPQTEKKIWVCPEIEVIGKDEILGGTGGVPETDSGSGS